MKKQIALILSIVMICALLGGCGSSQSTATPAAQTTTAENSPQSAPAEKYVLKMHLSVGETDPVADAAREFKRIVEEGTDGNIEIQIYPSSSLGNVADCLEGLSLGACDIVYDAFANLTPLTYIANADPIPYVYSNLDHYKAVWLGDVGKEILADVEADCGMTLMYGGTSGVRVLTSNVPVRGPEDVKGLKIRVPTTPIYIDTWDWLGANPTPLPGSEIFTALQQGTVDAQENGLPGSASASFHEVVKYVTETNHVYSSLVFVMDTDFFASLPESYQEVIRGAAETVAPYCIDRVMERTEEARQVFRDAGCEFLETDVSAWQAAMDGFFEEKYPDLVKYRDMIAAVDPTK